MLVFCYFRYFFLLCAVMTSAVYIGECQRWDVSNEFDARITQKGKKYRSTFRLGIDSASYRVPGYFLSDKDGLANFYSFRKEDIVKVRVDENDNVASLKLGGKDIFVLRDYYEGEERSRIMLGKCIAFFMIVYFIFWWLERKTAQ